MIISELWLGRLSLRERHLTCRDEAGKELRDMCVLKKRQQAAVVFFVTDVKVKV